MVLATLLGLFVASCCEREIIEDSPKEGWVIPVREDWAEIQVGGEGMSEWGDDGITVTIRTGVELTGIRYEGSPPASPYELELEARKVSGSDFFCGLTFPIHDPEAQVTLILGGWGGGTIGISSINGKDASENETTSYRNFAEERWYHVHLQVEESRLRVRLDGEVIVDLETAGKVLSLRKGSIESCAPLGLATWQTTGQIRNLRWRSLAD